MAHVLRITDGTTTVTFTSSPMKIMEYAPQVSMDGSDVQETARIDFNSATQATNFANIQAVNNLLAQARNYQNSETGARVYVEFDPGASGTTYRSLVKGGSVHPDPEMIKNKYFNHKNLIMDIEWIRQPFWEGPLTQIPLTNSSATNNTTGITITNSYDSTAQNYVDIDDAAVIGDLPAPVKIQMENTKSGAAGTTEIYIWHNVYSTPPSFNPILEGEDAYGSTVTDSGADATSSSDLYTTLAWTALVETVIAEWTISSALATNAAGGRFAVLARWRGAFPYTNAWIRCELNTSTGVVLWLGNLTLISSTRELALLDVIRLPPYLFGQASIKEIALQLRGYRNQSGTHSITLDYLQLSPISGDAGWRRFLSLAAGIAYQEFFVQDDTDNFIYRIDTGSKLISEFSSFGGPILLVPGKDQRLYFNSCDSAGAAKVDQTWKIKAWYRPRRNAL